MSILNTSISSTANSRANSSTNPIATLQAVTTAERLYDKTRLLVFQGPQEIHHRYMADFAASFQAGDVLVVNRSATLPASFWGQVQDAHSGQTVPLEIRLAAFQGPEPSQPLYWQAIAFGAGDWRQPTELRGKPPVLVAGDVITFGDDLSAHILQVENERLLTLRFDSENLLPALYAHGQPIQYAYHTQPLEVWDQQTLFSGPPISVEPPSASFSLSGALLKRLQARGVRLVSLLHSAGLSSTGDAALDARLPLAEWYDIPADTVRHILNARAQGRRVMALGTTVMRALESAAQRGEGFAMPESRASLTGLSRLKVRPGYRFQVVNALVTGMHEPESSHMHILKTLCPLALIQQGYQEAADLGYRGHEYGDLSLVNCGCQA